MSRPPTDVVQFTRWADARGEVPTVDAIIERFGVTMQTAQAWRRALRSADEQLRAAQRAKTIFHHVFGAAQ